jgi:diguanylate cyclase (GGDEF)-like protein
VILFSLYSLLVEKKAAKFAVSLSFGLMEFLLFLYTLWIYKRGKYSVKFIYPGFSLFFACLVLFNILSSITEHGLPEIDSTIFFLYSQIIFVMNPLMNLCMNLFIVLLFTALTVPYYPSSIWMPSLINVIVMAITGMVFTWYMSYVAIKGMIIGQRLEAERNRFEEESNKDDLTGLNNRRNFMESVNFYRSVCRHVRQTICVIMLDVDYFKKYNDFYGHPKGDLVLEAIGRVLEQVMIEEGVYAARVGGEEFIVLGTENRLAESERIAIKIRQMIIDLKIPHEQSEVAPWVTASLGVYIMRGGSTDTVEELYSRVDTVLYEAKRLGRNRIVLRDSAAPDMRTVALLPPEMNRGRRQDQ